MKRRRSKFNEFTIMTGRKPPKTSVDQYLGMYKLIYPNRKPFINHTPYIRSATI